MIRIKSNLRQPNIELDWTSKHALDLEELDHLYFAPVRQCTGRRATRAA